MLDSALLHPWPGFLGELPRCYRKAKIPLTNWRTNKQNTRYISFTTDWIEQTKAMVKQFFQSKTESVTVVTWREWMPERENCGGGCSDHVRRSEVEVWGFRSGVVFCILLFCLRVRNEVDLKMRFNDNESKEWLLLYNLNSLVWNLQLHLTMPPTITNNNVTNFGSYKCKHGAMYMPNMCRSAPLYITLSSTWLLPPF